MLAHSNIEPSPREGPGLAGAHNEAYLLQYPRHIKLINKICSNELSEQLEAIGMNPSKYKISAGGLHSCHCHGSCHSGGSCGCCH